MATPRELADVVSASPSTDINIDNGTLVVDISENRVGIGTTAPESKLDIKVGSAGSVTAWTEADDLILESNTTVGMSILSPDGSSARLVFGSPSANQGATVFYRQNINKMNVGTLQSGGKLALRSGADVDALYIDENQNVGIGTTAPAVPLDINIGTNNNAVYCRSSDQFCNIALTDNAGSVKIGSDNGAFFIETGGTTSFTSIIEAMRIDSSGKVGIGTSAPDYNFTVTDGGTDTQTIVDITAFNDQTGYPPDLIFRKSHNDTVGTKTATTDNTILGRVIFNGVDSGSNFDWGAYIQGTQDGAASNQIPAELSFYTSDGGGIYERMIIKKDGNVGIGTTAPASQLEVVNTSYTSSVIGGKLRHGVTFQIEESTQNPATVVAYSTIDSAVTFGVQRNKNSGTYNDAWTMGLPEDSKNFQISKDTLGAAVTVDTSGNVGIGTTAPVTLLHVGDSTGTSDLSAQNNKQLICRSGGEAKMTLFRAGTPANGTTAGEIVFGSANANDQYWWQSGRIRSVAINTTSGIRQGNLVFSSSGNNGQSIDAMTIEHVSSGTQANVTIETGNLIIGTAGKGITFQSASGTGTGNTANTLDDYETGTFTATCSNSVTLYSGLDQCKYTKIGEQVTVRGQVRVNSDNGGAVFQINNLPFTAKAVGADNDNYAIGAVRTYLWELDATDLWVICQIDAGSDILGFLACRDNAAAAAIQADSGAYIMFTISYTAS